MTKFRISLFSTLVAFIICSCNENLSSVGQGIQPQADGIDVAADTFMLQSDNVANDYIYARTDSFLIGRYVDSEYGTTHADLLMQLACPEGYQYPDGAVVDSAELFIYYNSYFGYANTAMRLSAYQMDRGTFSYSTGYPTNLDLADYCSLADSTLVGQRIISPLNPTDSVYGTYGYVYYVRIRASAEWAERFFNTSRQHMQTQEDFNQNFNGLYLTCDYGSAAMLNVSQIDLALHYHFSYTRTDGTSGTAEDTRVFPANSEVRPVNLISHPDKAAVMSRLNSTDSVNYIVSPAGIYTRVTLPMKHIKQSIQSKMGGRKLFVNNAMLQVEGVNISADDKYQPAQAMLLVREDTVSSFFNSRLPLNDRYAILAYLNAVADNTASGYTYVYQYDLGEIIEQAIEEQNDDPVSLLLIPVSVATSSTSSGAGVTNIQHQMQMTGVAVRSAKNTYQPLKLSVVYSGF